MGLVAVGQSFQFAHRQMGKSAARRLFNGGNGRCFRSRHRIGHGQDYVRELCAFQATREQGASVALRAFNASKVAIDVFIFT